METKGKAVNMTASPERQDKDRDFLFQRQRVYQSFRERPKTMLQVSQETGIYRANICRYIHRMKAEGTKYRLPRGLCPISKNKAIFWTTNLNIALNYWAYEILSEKEYGSDEQIAILACLKSYIVSGYTSVQVAVPEELAETWDEVKREIDRRIAL